MSATEEIEGLEARLVELLDERLEALVDDIANLEAVLAADKAELKRLTRRRLALVPSPAAEAAQHRCDVDECGRTFASQQGLSMHKTRSHKPAEAPAPATDPTKPYVCETCETPFRRESLLKQHTLNDHNRPATDAERTPIITSRTAS